MSLEIEIESGSLSSADLQAALAEYTDGTHVQFEERERTSEYRNMPVAVVVAIMSGGSAALSALISGIFAFITSRRPHGGQIVIRSSDGRSIEFPPDTPPGEIPRLVELVHQLDHPTIELP
jgi:Effector Associated Constant Component 1